MSKKLYILHGSPPVRAVLMTAKALDITLEEHEIDFFKNEHHSPEYLKINPQHSIPTLDDDGYIVVDSHAINCYLVNEYGGDSSLYPKDPQKRAMVDQMLHFDCGTLFQLLRDVDLKYLTGQIKEVPDYIIEQANQLYDLLEKFLEKSEWLAGDDVTIADFSAIATTTSLNYHVKIDPEVYPKITSWIERANALPCLDGDEKELEAFANIFDGVKEKF